MTGAACCRRVLGFFSAERRSASSKFLQNPPVFMFFATTGGAGTDLAARKLLKPSEDFLTVRISRSVLVERNFASFLLFSGEYELHFFCDRLSDCCF